MSRTLPQRRLIRMLADRYRGLVVLGRAAEPWWSANFAGTRHVIICAAGTDLSGIEEAEFVLPGHLVADITVLGSGDRQVIEALTIKTF